MVLLKLFFINLLLHFQMLLNLLGFVIHIYFFLIMIRKLITLKIDTFANISLNFEII